MKKDLTLVILAAGMGSRFGGLKQIEPVGPNGEFIIDYSIYDAIRYGFNKVVFVIKEENFEIFKETIGNRIANQVKVEYAFQKMDDIPDNVVIPDGRVKPWGTAHALYCARNCVHEPFALISADDFYGEDSFKILSEQLSSDDSYSVVGYKIGKTISDQGSVKRGVCFEKDGQLDRIVESKVEKVDGVIYGVPLAGGERYTMSEDQPVSMLMYGIQKEVFDYIEKDIVKFFDDNKENLESCEYLLPDVLSAMKKNGNKMVIIPTIATWYGVTYKEDKETVVNAINNYIKSGVYPSKLWK